MKSTVSQVEFIRIGHETKNIIGIEQSITGAVCLQLRPTVQIIHRHNHRHIIEIIFTETQEHYAIPDRRTLLYLLKMHEQNQDFVQRFRGWCNQNLESL